MQILKFALKRACRGLGIEIRRTSSRNDIVLNALRDPLVYQYCSDLVIRPFIALRLQDVRAGVMGFPYLPTSKHPFALACSLAKPTKNPTESVRLTLNSFYSAVRPASALEVVDLTESDAPGLKHLAVHKWITPWSELNIDENASHRRICLEEEGWANRSILSVSDGFTLFGPVSAKKLEMESRRLAEILRSVEVRGFVQKSGQSLEVLGLRAGTEYRWFVTQGQHRFAVCASLGILEVPAKVMRIVRREDASFWPKVVDGTFSEAGAVKFFDRIFAGIASRCAAAWLAGRVGGRDQAPHESLTPCENAV